MARKKVEFHGKTYRDVLGFTARHWRRQPGRISFIFASIMVATLAAVLTPYYAGQLVNAVASGAADDPALLDAAIMAFMSLLGLGVVHVVLRFVAFRQTIALTLRMMGEIVNETFFKVQRFSTDWHANTFAGSTVRKVTRGMWALDLLNDTILVALFPSLIMLIGTTVLLAVFWPVMGLVVGLGSLIFIVVTIALTVGYVSPAATLSNAWDTKLGGALADAISCNAVVKGFGAEAREETRLDLVVAKWRKRTLRTWNRFNLNGFAQDVGILLLRAVILGTGIMLWQQGVANAGDIAFVLTAFFVLQGYLQDVGMHFRNLQRSINDMEELVALDGEPFGVADRPNATPIRVGDGAIAFKSVTFQYGGHNTPLYKDFSVDIQSGERVGLVGHSGSGKTTFVKLIQRLHDINSGAIEIDGQDIAKHTQSSLRGQIAIVQQDPILFHRSLAENIAYGRPGATREQIEAAAEQANAHGFIAKMPKGYETLVGERGVKLSGGERQRVAIARAFLADAPILILDEATSSLDSESEATIQEAIERLMKGRTTLVIAHRLSTVRALDRILVFDKGEIVEEGDHMSLIRREKGIYRRLFEKQALELTKGLVA
ncbi:ABC transporter ATP-binding protein [Pelagibacterium lentulum]|uniref:Multidrug ABC transporter ATP-binding protein n=1 Tax=Pelagibacterium lentulum TaxID=2029865 RepID=A0A916VZ27_9HYPH|nr:ABC transporter ATP-binding protein [Pelagibacterium lentulum]GGA54519.1 multidrug ABC transporter ATP-binding protein [Pelagibacterium lentulum]